MEKGCEGNADHHPLDLGWPVCGQQPPAAGHLRASVGERSCVHVAQGRTQA